MDNLACVGTVMQGSWRVGQLALVHERTDRFEGAESSETLRVIFFPLGFLTPRALNTKILEITQRSNSPEPEMELPRSTRGRSREEIVEAKGTVASRRA